MHFDTPQSICRFGIATGDITPPVGIYHRMWGAASHHRATGVHRPLRATAAVFAPADEASDPQGQQNLLALDHCIMGRREMDALLETVSREANVPREQVAVVFSHTHAAGLMSLDRAPQPGGDLIAPYLEHVAKECARLVRDAVAQMQPATIVYGRGSCELAAHRDLWDEASGQFVCGFNPDVPAESTLIVARVTDEEDRILATAVNYACHPTTLAWDNTLISPDFPGAMREVVEGATGAPCLFLQGASAELGPREGFVGDVEIADRNGRQLGYAALSALASLPPPRTRYRYVGPVLSGATIGFWQHEPLPAENLGELKRWSSRRFNIPLAYRPELPAIEQVQQELQHWQAAAESDAHREEEAAEADARALAERKKRLLSRLEALPAGEAYPLQVVLWRAGGALWLAVQGEHYSLLQTELRKRFPGVPIIVMTIAFDWTAAYLPPAGVYGQGIYQESIAIVAAGSLEKVIAEVGDAIERTLAGNGGV